VEFQSYEQVARLSAREASAVLSRGDAQERVWASWVVAAAYGERAIDGLVVALAGEPDAGVRRHLLVVLAGLAALRVVAEAAARDADADVRATASRYLARLVEPDLHAEYDLLVARTIDLAPEVRLAVADALRTDAPPGVVRAAAGLLFDPDPDVREGMRHRVDRGDFPRAPFEAALAVLRRMERRPTSPSPGSNRRALVKYRPPLRLV
jgi:hypothetical protein